MQKIEDKINDVETKVEEQSSNIDINEMDTIRSRVLLFANSLRNGTPHEKWEYDYILGLNDKYEKLLKKRNITNGVFSADMEFIRAKYSQWQHKT